MGTVVTVEPVEAKTQLRRFRDVPFLLHGHDPRWKPGVRAYESWLVDARRHPYFDTGDAAYFLARRAGRPVGRIAAHRSHAGEDDAWFGLFDAPDDDEVVGDLLAAAEAWLRAEGAHSMTGPVTWRPDEEFGTLVAGHDHPSVTGRRWQPAWYAETLRRAGLTPGAARDTYRLAVDDAAVDEPASTSTTEAEAVPPHAGGYADPALVLEGIAAVPDVSATIATASIRTAWRVARQARRDGFDTAVCVRCSGEPGVLVPRLLGAARQAGYRWLLAPWAPAGVAPETTHQVFTRRWT